jgi:hypothetical protein
MHYSPCTTANIDYVPHWITDTRSDVHRLTLYEYAYFKRSWNRASLDVYFIYPTRCNLYNVLYYYQRPTCFGRYFRPSSGAYKTVCAALGIVMLSCCIPPVWMCWNSSAEQLQPIHTSGRRQESMTILKAAHTVLKAPDDGRKYRPKHVERW